MKAQPKEHEVEQSVLASIFHDQDHREKAIEILNTDDFYATVHQIIFKKCQELSRNCNSLEVVAVWAELPAYKIAWSAGVNPTMLSKLINGIERPKPNDQRIINVGKVLGIPENECFEEIGR